ncbi:DUF2956 family protein [Thalassotalea sp. ND16A]|uniref:DUF2956 family protein n=1 Tax=Thalassotalea sp. ND16A TaxID=1535422 RepID=UPI00051A5435|nr:DUF2956 family protein [Thalassotalea sp. ND16A]KGJ99286.1 hypothetical protein ND16A_3807 [Thalassotalea sp. ND16A]
MKKQQQSPSAETIATAQKVAAGIKKPGQTKEQTKLIEQGIQKGIEQFKKAQKAKSRDANKAKKKQQKLKAEAAGVDINQDALIAKQANNTILPWALLLISWLGFAGYLALQ